MRSFLFLSILLFLGACQSKDPALQDIEQLELEVETNATAENTAALLEQYRNYVDTHLDETNTAADLLYKSAALQFRMNRYSATVKLLQEALKDHYEAKKTPEIALFLALVYQDGLKNPEGANAVYQAFVQAFPKHKKSAALQDSLAGIPPIPERLDALKGSMYNEETNRIEFSVANDFIGISEIHALLLPDNPKSPDFLHEAGKTAGYIRSFPKAIELYQWIYDRYPEHEKATQALFMMAFTYDNEIKDSEKATRLYREFIQKYPEDEFADDAQFLLNNLGKSDEEIIESFEGE